MLMKKNEGIRLKRTLTAVLLMFVLSFSAVFAEGENPEAAAGGSDNVQAEAVQPAAQEPAAQEAAAQQTENQQPAAQEPEVQQPAAVQPVQPQPAPQVSRIIKRGRYYYYKYPSGKIRKKAGFVRDLGKIYYIRKGGKIRTGRTFRVKKKYYRANGKGVVLTGVYKWNKKYNYSDSNGVWKKTAGFVHWKGKTYYVKKGGTIITNDAFSVKNIPYDADKYGRVTKLDIPDGGGDPVIGIAKAQVGIMTGKTYWRWYFKTRFRDTDRTPWCGAFVAWCYNAAGQYKRVTVAKKFGNLGYVPSYSRFADKYKKWVKRANARPGDIIVFGRNMHVGLVEGVYGNYIFTIEGNAGPTAAIGSKKPGAVVRNVYRINNKKIKGVIRP